MHDGSTTRFLRADFGQGTFDVIHETGDLLALEASGPGRSGVAFVLDTQNNFHHLAHDEDVFEWELVSSVPGQGYAGATYLWLGDGL